MLTATLIFAILCFLLLIVVGFGQLYIIGQNNQILATHRFVLKDVPKIISDLGAVVEKNKHLMNIVKDI